MSSVEAVQLSVTCPCESELADRPPGAVGGVESTPAMAQASLLGSDLLPASSKASTV